MTKYDFLVTEVQDKLAESIRLLQEYNEIDKNLTLREVYNKYFHPSVLPIEDENIWKVLQENSILNIFQFDSEVGRQAAKKIKPSSILEMSNANGLMRLMTSEKGQETPMEKYIRFKTNPFLWYEEMSSYNLTKEEQASFEKYIKTSYGIGISQECLMKALMDPELCNFSLAEANQARKIIGKKKMSEIPILKDKVFDKAINERVGRYIWNSIVSTQLGYSFSEIHALAYSFIGFQTMFIATKWNPIYWNTACLIVNSGSLEEDEEFEIEEDKNGEKLIKKEKSTDYAKVAKALGDIISKGIKISLVDINKSNYSFEPDVNNNQILFGMKALNSIGDNVIETIIANRPYKNFTDFMQRCPLNKTAMISLIKAGSFDSLEKKWAEELNIEPRYLIMIYYLSKVCDMKKKLTLQNFNGLMQKDLIPSSLKLQKRIFNFNKYLKTKKFDKYYYIDDISLRFLFENFQIKNLQIINGNYFILQTVWDKMYKNSMDLTRDWLKENQEKVLKEFNYLIFKESWDKYATGSLSAWEMDSLCFYYHNHELKNVDVNKYGISNFFDMPEEPEIDYFYKRNGKEIPIFKIRKIIGTVISKNDTKSSVSLLTTSGVVNVKFTKEYFAMFNRQISEIQDDGTKKVKEKGWMTRGTKLMIAGIRKDDTFLGKTYKHTPIHQIYKITNIYSDGSMELVHERYSA